MILLPKAPFGLLIPIWTAKADNITQFKLIFWPGAGGFLYWEKS